MIRILLSAALLVGTQAFAGELDNEHAVTNRSGSSTVSPAQTGSQKGQKLHGTIILRVNKSTHKAEYFQTNVVPKSKVEAENLAKVGSFKAVPANAVRKELDRASGSSSWYFYPGYAGYGYGGGYGGYAGYGYGYGGYGYGGYGYSNFGYSNLYYYGATYSPCYNYSYGAYNYAYYSPYSYGW